jgi:hypothetical protein
MRRDALATLLRLRESEVDEAKRALAACLRKEEELTRAEREAEAALRQERAAAEDLRADDVAVEAYAAWLPRGRAALAAAQEQRVRAEACTAHARAVLAASRAAAQVIAERIESRAAIERMERARRQQLALDEAGQRARNGGTTEDET